MTRITRRAVIGGGFAAAVGLGVGIPILSGLGATNSTGNLLRSQRPLPKPYQRPLVLPAVLRPVRSDATTDYYEITQRRALASILPGVQTAIWSYNGTFPGPTIESRHGRAVSIRHTNQLPLPTVVHLHGGRTPESSDGYPIDYLYPRGYRQPMRMPGERDRFMPMPVGHTRVGARDYVYPLDQRASTLWYHDHRMDFTGPSVWRGLAGFHLHRDAEEAALHLPSGARELPLMIMDRSFDAAGQLRYPSVDPTLASMPGVRPGYIAGVLGDTMLVNGVPWPVASVDGAQYRLRLLNASNARRLSLRLDPAPPHPITQIGTDGGLLAAPITHDHLELAPAQRFDVIVDFAGYRPGTTVTLVNDFGDGRMGEVMRFRVGERADDGFRMPDRLSSIEPLRASSAVTTRTLRFTTGEVAGHSGGGMKGWVINGMPYSPDTIAARATLGTVEVWRLIADFHHPVHLHLNPFQVLSRGDGGPGQFDAGWKDTIDLRPAEEAAIAIRFDGYRGKYVFHCHNLEHEDMAMMGNFTVS